MIASVPSSFLRWGRPGLALVLTGLLYVSCTTSEDTEPFVPPVLGATQPEGGGDVLSEDDACERLRSAALDAYDSLGCTEPDFEECPAFLRPGGGSGCWEYSASSVEACEDVYRDANSCRELSPCVATAVLNTELPTCELPVVPSVGGAGGAGSELGGAGGQAPVAQAGQASGGAPGAGGVPSAAGGTDGSMAGGTN